MKRGARSLLALCAVFAAVAAAPTRADPCQPKQAITLPIRTGPRGSLEVPLQINGQPAWFAIDTGGIFSMITYPLAAKLEMRLKPFPFGMQLYGGVQLTEAAFADTLQIGSLTAKRFGFLAAPQSVFELDQGGVVGPDIMQNYDVDIDIAAGRFGFYAPGACASPVRAWNGGNYVRLPFTLTGDGHILLPLVLDGKTIQAILDTGAQTTTTTLETAERLYGIRSNDPNLKPLRAISINGLKGTQDYRYPFRSLMMGSLESRSPVIDIISQQAAGIGAPELLVGLTILRQYHIYIAYKEHALYLTPAEAR